MLVVDLPMCCSSAYALGSEDFDYDFDRTEVQVVGEGDFIAILNKELSSHLVPVVVVQFHEKYAAEQLELAVDVSPTITDIQVRLLF